MTRTPKDWKQSRKSFASGAARATRIYFIEDRDITVMFNGKEAPRLSK